MHKIINIIATHSGKFHADDVFGVATLKLLFPDAKVIRSRDEAILKTADVRIDVGGIHDPAHGGFDHHQAGFSKVRENGIPYASFGLIWDVFGAQLCESQDIAMKIEVQLVQPIDAIDNGIDGCLTDHIVMPYTISHIVDVLNPAWNSTQTHDDAFAKALDIATTILDSVVKKQQSIAAADNYVQQKAEEFSNEPYVILDEYVPTNYLVDHTNKLFAVYPDPNSNWTVMSLSVDAKSFESRKMLPESWAGLTNQDLAKITGVSDAVFCHRGRWICSAKSKEGAIKMLELALKNA